MSVANQFGAQFGTDQFGPNQFGAGQFGARVAVREYAIIWHSLCTEN